MNRFSNFPLWDLENQGIDDESIHNQTWACVSFITPELVKGCNGRFIKILKGENQKGVVVQKMTKKLGLEKKNGKVGS